VPTGRVYLPTTASMLARARDDGRLALPLRGHAVTEALVRALDGAGEEELEHAALTEAALDALQLFGPDDPPRRVVVVVDPAVWRASDNEDEVVSAVVVTREVPLRLVAAVHVDSLDAASAVAAARDALAAGGDVDHPAVQRCLDHEPGWYAVQELDELLAGLLG
jgi:hypothetical protein